MKRPPIVEEDLRRICAAPLPWEDLAGRTILISGAAGFLARYLVETLLFLNETRPGFACRVLGVVRNLAAAQQKFAHVLNRADFRLIEQDICQPLALDAPPDFILHVASQASPRYYGVDPAGTLAPNVLGTFHLLELARHAACRGFLFFSSAEVYGDCAKEQISETDFGALDPAQVRSCYGESKRMGETMCVAWQAQFGVPARIVRPFHTYGPGLALADGRVFADFVANLVRNENLEIKSDGRARRAYCYLADATAGFWTVLLQGTPGGVYNVGHPAAERSVRELADELAGIFPEKNLRVLPSSSEPGSPHAAASRFCPDISKMAALGWKPSTSIAAGFRRTVLSYL